MRSIIARTILALGLATGLAPFAHAQQGVTDTEIRIGSNGDLSGVFAAFNVGAIKAAQQMFDEVNANGGIHGRQIRFIVEDHGYQVPRAVQNFNKLVNSDQVFAMILNLGTPHNIAGFPIMEARQVHNVAPLTAARQMLEGDISLKWAGFSSYYDQLRAGVKYLAEETGARNVCAMYFPSDFGLEYYEGARDQAEAMGLNFAAETQHRPDEQDFVGALTRLRDANCEIVATGLGVRQIIIAVATAKRLGWEDVRFMGGSASFNTAIAKVEGGVTEGYLGVGGWSDFEARLDTPEVREWAEAYQAAHGEPVGTAAQLGYSAARTLVLALEAAGPDLNPDTFREAMEGLSFYDPINDVEVEYGEDHQGANLVYINEIRDGMWHEIGRLDPASLEGEGAAGEAMEAGEAEQAEE